MNTLPTPEEALDSRTLSKLYPSMALQKGLKMHQAISNANLVYKTIDGLGCACTPLGMLQTQTDLSVVGKKIARSSTKVIG